MAQGKKINIQFQSTGIDDISKQLKQLQDEASKVVLTDNLDDQFSELVDKAKEVEDVLDELNKAFNSDNNVKKSKKTKQLTEMEEKIADVKKAVSSLTQQLGKAKTKVDQSVDRIDTAFQNINNQSFDGLLSQMQKVQNGFDDLIAKAKDYKDILASKVQTVSSSKSSNNTSAGFDDAKKELDNLKKQANAMKSALDAGEKGSATGDKYLHNTTRELKAVLDKFEDRIKQAQSEYQNANSDEETHTALIKVIRIVEEFNSMYNFSKNPSGGKLYEEQNAYLARLDSVFEEMDKSLLHMISQENRNDPYSYYRELKDAFDKINARISELNKVVNKQKSEVKIDEKTLAEEVDDKLTVRDIKKKTVELKVVVPEEEAQRAMSDINGIVDKINDSPSSVVHLKVAFSGATKIKNYDQIIKTLADNISKVGDDPEAKQAVQDAVEKINKYFDAKLAIDTSDLDRIAKGVPAAMKKIRDQVAQDTLFLPVKLDPQDIHEQKKELEEQLGTLTVPIGKITVQDNLIDTGKLEKAAKKSAEKVAKQLPTWNKIRNSMLESAKKEELDAKTYKGYQQIINIMKELGIESDKAEESVKQMMTLVNNYVDAEGANELEAISKSIQNIGKQYETLRKAKEKANEEPKDAGEILQDNIIKFIQDINKIPSIIRDMKKQIGEVEIDGKVVLDAKQVQNALNDLDDLELRIARLDIYQPTLDKIKLTVKEDLVGLAKAQKDLVKALNKFKDKLIPDDAENGPSALEVKLQSLIDSINQLGKYFVSVIQSIQNNTQVENNKKTQDNTEDIQKNQDIINSIVTEIKGISKQLDDINASIGQIYSKQNQPVRKQDAKDDSNNESLKDVYKDGNKPKATLRKSENETLDRLRKMTQEEVTKGISTNTKVARGDEDNVSQIASWGNYVAKLGTIAKDTASILSNTNALQEITQNTANVLSNSKTGKSNVVSPLGNLHYISDPNTAKPTIFYRGVDTMAGGTFASGNYKGSYWSDNPQVASTYGNGVKIEVAKLIANNPLEIDGKGFSWENVPYFAYGKGGPVNQIKRETDKFKSRYYKEDEVALSDFNNTLTEILRNLSEEDKDGYARVKEFGELLKEQGIQQKAINEYLSMLERNLSQLAKMTGEDSIYGFRSTNEWEAIAEKMGYDSLIMKNVYDTNNDVDIPSTVVSQLNPNNIEFIKSTTIDELTNEIQTATQVLQQVNDDGYQTKIIGSLDELKQLVRNLDSNNPLSYGSLTGILKDWIKANEIMDESGDEKERLMLANLSKMMVSNPFVAGRYDHVSEDTHNILLNDFKEIVDLVIHSHPERYAVQSPEDIANILDYRSIGNPNAKSLVVAKNQMSIFDPSVMDELDVKPFIDEFDAKVEEFKSELKAVNPNEIIDPDVFQQLVRNALVETFNTFKNGKYSSQMDDIFRTITFNSVDDINDNMFAGLVMSQSQIKQGTSVRNNTFERLLKEFQDSKKFKYLDNFAAKKGLNEKGYNQLEQLAIEKGVEFKTRKKPQEAKTVTNKDELNAQKEALRIDKERVQVHNEDYKTRQALAKEEIKQDQEKVKVYNEEYKTRKAIEQTQEKEALKKDQERVKVANEEYKTRQAIAQQQEKEIKSQERLSKAITKAETQTYSPYTTEKDRNILEKYIDDMKQLKGLQGVTNSQIDTAINNYEEAYLKADKGARKYIDDLKKITQEANKGNESKYMPSYMDEARAYLRQVQSGNYNAKEIEDFISRKTASASNRGNKTTLENYITKGETMLSRNYLPGNLKNQLQDVISQMRALDRQADVSAESVNQLGTSFRYVEAEAGKVGKTFIGQIGQRLQDMNAKFIATYFSFMDIIRYMRSMISTITELDTALTEMRKVSDESLESLKEYQKTTFDVAGALGTTAVQLQQSTADWLRLGESMDEAAKSAKAATMLFNVSEFENVGDATNALVAMSQAYQDLDKTEIIDVMNNIGNNYAIATDQLATALQASAASLMTQGNDLYEAAALVTAGNQIIQDASKTGTGLRTIALRIGGIKEGDDDIKAELEELGEEVDDWVVSTQAKKRQVIMDYTKVASNNGMGVDILDTNGNLKDTYTILLEIAKVYEEIQKEDKKYGTNRAKGLVEELAGKNRSNIAASILMNPQLLEDVYNSALNSSGSAAEENAKYLDSIVGKTQQFKNELQELEQNLIDSEWIKDVIDFGTQVLSIVNKLGKGLPAIATGIASIAATIGLLKDKTQGILKFDEESGALGLGRGKLNIGSILSKGDKSITDIEEVYTKPVLKFGDALKDVFTIDFNNKDLRDYFEIMSAAPDDIEGITVAYDSLDESIKQMADTLRNQGVKSLDDFDQAAQETKAASKSAAIGVSILNTAIMSIATFAISMAIGALINGFKSLAESTDKAADSAMDFRNELKDIRDEVRSNRKYLDDNTEEYARLSKEVDAFGNNISLSNDEFERYNNISNQIADMFPELVSGWTETGDAILKVKDNVEGLNEAYEKNKKLQLQKLISDDSNAKTIFKDYEAFQKVNPIEYWWANLTGKKQTGVSDSYKSQKEFYESFLKLTYDDLKNPRSKNLMQYGNANWGVTGDEAVAGLVSGGIPNLFALSQGRAKRYLDFDMLKANADDLAIAQQKAEAALATMESEMDERLRGMRDLASAYLELQPNYDNVDEKTKEVASLIVNSLDENMANSFKDAKDLAKYSTDVLEITKGLDTDVVSTALQNDIKGKNFKETKKEIEDAYGQIYVDLSNQAQKALQSGDTQKFNTIVDMMNTFKEHSQLDGMIDLENRFNELNKSIASDGDAMARLNSVTKDFTTEQVEWWLDNVNATMNEVEAINKLNDAIEKGTFNHYESIGALLSQNSFINGTDTQWSEIREELVGLAQAGKLDEQTLKDYKWFNDILQELGLSAEEAEDKLAGMVEEIDKLSKKNAVDDLSNYRNEIEKLGDAYSKFKKGEFIDANTLSALQDAFGDLDSYQAFEEAVLRGETDLQHYFDDIVTEYANQHKILNELTDANKEWVKQQLVASGITKESADAAVEDALKHKNALEKEVRAEIEALNSTKEIAQGKKELAIDTANLDKITIDEVNALLAETQATGIGAEKLKFFAAQKALAAMTGIRNNDDIDYLIKICELAGLGTEYLVNLKSMGDINYDKRIADAQKEMRKYEGKTDKNSIRRYNNAKNAYESGVRDKAEYEKQMKNALPDAQKAFDEKYKGFKYDFTGKFDFEGISDSASEAGSDAGEAFKDALDKILAMYDAELDAGVITFQTYVDKSRQAIEQYYAEGKIKASEYYDYLANLYQKQVSEYDKVISAVQRLLKKQTDELQKQKESIEESYNLQIEEIQKKIDALRDENDEIDKNMALQKAQYNLARAQNQRTKLMYSESRGFYYEADLKGVHDAQEEVRKAQLDKTIFDLEKQIKVLQDQMKKETDEIDKQIKALNEYSEAWAEVSSKLQNAIEDQRAAQILGQDWEKQILDQRLDTLQNFTDQYVALQQAQKDAYLAARQAEANAALGGGGSSVSPGVKRDDGNKNPPPSLTEDQKAAQKNLEEQKKNNAGSQKYSFNGKTYSSITEAQAAQRAYVASFGDKAYKDAYNKAMQSPIPDQNAKKKNAEQAGKVARAQAEAEARKLQIRALYTGTDSAKSGEALVGEKGHEIVVGNDGIATIVNEPTLMKMQGGEKVFNADETDKILKKSVPLKKFNPKKFALLQSFANGTTSPMQTRIAAQAVGLANGLSTGMLNVQGAGGQTINQTFNVSLPNITDQSKASELFKEFEHMQMKATQFFNR